MRRVLSVCLLMLTLVGCASIRDTDQSLSLACNTPECQVQVQQTGQTWKAPSIAKVERQKSLDLKFTSKGQTQHQKLTGKLRWKESVVANGIFSLFGPTGWVFTAVGLGVDWLTGNIWELSSPTVATFKDQDYTPVVGHIIIAPVQAPTQFDSEEASAEVLRYLRKAYPKANIEVAEKYLHEFSDAKWDHEGPSEENWRNLDLYSKLPSYNLAIAKVISSGVMQIEVRDVLREKQLHKGKASFTVSSESNYATSWLKSQALGMAPNAVTIKKASATSGGFAVQSDQTSGSDSILSFYSLSSSPGVVKPSSEWGISIVNMEPDLGRRFDSVFKMTFEGSIRKSSLYVSRTSFNTYTFEQKTLGSVDRYFVEGGVGPEIGVVGPFGYFYSNLIFSVEMAYFDYSGDFKDEIEVYSPIKTGLGYKLQVSDHIQFGVEVGLRAMPEWVSNKIVEKYSGEDVKTTYSFETMSSLSFTYYFPEIKTQGHKRLRDLLVKK